MEQFLIQALGFLAMALCIGSYQLKSGRSMILCKTAGDLIYMIHFLLLGGYSGCVTLAVSVVSQTACSFRGRKKWADWKGWRWLFTAVLVIACLLVWQKSFRPVPCISAMISMGSVSMTTWTGNARAMRINKLLCAGPFWIIYAAATGSVSGVLCESVGMLSAAVALRRTRPTDAAPDRTDSSET